MLSAVSTQRAACTAGYANNAAGIANRLRKRWLNVVINHWIIIGAIYRGAVHAAITPLNCCAGERETSNGRETKVPAAAKRETWHLFV